MRSRSEAAAVSCIARTALGIAAEVARGWQRDPSEVLRLNYNVKERGALYGASRQICSDMGMGKGSGISRTSACATKSAIDVVYLSREKTLNWTDITHNALNTAGYASMSRQIVVGKKQTEPYIRRYLGCGAEAAKFLSGDKQSSRFYETLAFHNLRPRGSRPVFRQRQVQT